MNLYAVTAYGVTGVFAAPTGARARYLTYIACREANFDVRWTAITRCRRLERGTEHREGHVSCYADYALYQRYGIPVDFS